jgi:UDP-N-acetylglucosamine pyrophosphorylase
MVHEEALSLLARHGQSHLLRFWDELDGGQRDSLLADIAAIDFDLIAKLHADLVVNPFPVAGPSSETSIEPLRGERLSPRALSEAGMTGMEALRQGRCAAFLVAGGQGTRLGHDGPKGMFDIGLPSRKSLFQLQAERLRRLGRMAGRPVPWYIMTSRDNHDATVGFFREHAYFGLNMTDVRFFTQTELPLLDAEGKILLADTGRISLGPNGNGGCFPALKHSGARADMRARRGVWVFN